MSVSSARPPASIRSRHSSTLALNSSIMLSIPNASRSRLFDAQPRSNAAALSIVIQPSVIYVRHNASRTSSERRRPRCASSSKPTSSILPDIYGAGYIPLQQHLSTSFFASLQNNLPFFCCSQQHVFTSLPVSLHVIFDEAANATLAISIIAVSGSHLFSLFITSPPISSLQQFYDYN